MQEAGAARQRVTCEDEDYGKSLGRHSAHHRQGSRGTSKQGIGLAQQSGRRSEKRREPSAGCRRTEETGQEEGSCALGGSAFVIDSRVKAGSSVSS